MRIFPSMMFLTPNEMRLALLMLLTLMTAVLISFSAEAYIPTSQFIFNRVTATHGKGDYTIEAEVSFHEGLENVVLHESWIVVDGGEMRVQATGEGTRVFRILKRGRNFWVDEGGAEHSDEVSTDNIMRPLLTRSVPEEKKLFYTMGILSQEALREKKVPKELAEIKNEPESFVRLARVAGTVAYAYGEPEKISGPPSPGLWIEQDSFNIRKIRTPDNSEMTLNDYANYSKGLSLPRTESVVFDNHVVNIRLLKVNSVTLNSDQHRQLDGSWLRSHADTSTKWPKTAIGPVIQEFYKRFR